MIIYFISLKVQIYLTDYTIDDYITIILFMEEHKSLPVYQYAKCVINNILYPSALIRLKKYGSILESNQFFQVLHLLDSQLFQRLA